MLISTQFGKSGSFPHNFFYPSTVDFTLWDMLKATIESWLQLVAQSWAPIEFLRE